MSTLNLTFTIDQNQYYADFIGPRQGKQSNRWWYCDEFDIYIELPKAASEADVIAAFSEAAINKARAIDS